MRRTFLALACLATFLTACELSLAGDVIPPPEAVISSQGPAEPIVAPKLPLNLQNGAALYADSCAPCHGLSGLGDGEQADELPFFPAAIGDPDLARASSPEDWYRMVSQGRLARYMPPFDATLLPQQRWEVLAYVYSLGMDAAALERGTELYAENQNEADSLLEGLNPLTMEQSSLEPLDLAEEDLAALTGFLQARALGIELSSESAAQQPAATETGGDLPAFGSFRGQVKYGSGEGPLPAGLQATLSGFDHSEPAFTEIAEVSPGGEFAFTQIPLAPGRIFFVQVEYEGQIYFSEFMTAEGAETQFDAPIIIYETTSDTVQLVVESLQLVFDYYAPDVVRAVQRVSISNLGDQAVVPDETGSPVLHFQLPPQAANLAFEEDALGERYVAEEDGFGDLRGVLPGLNSYSLLFAYELPYVDGLSYSLSIDLPTQSLAVLLPEGKLELQNDGFQLIGTQALEGTTYRVFAASTGFQAGEAVPIMIRGQHPLGGGGFGWLADDSLLLGLAALTLAVGVLWLWVRASPARQPESILEEIAALDARYESGKIGKRAYSTRRAKLKRSLSQALDQGGKH
ncbi:MAG: cytochrome c [Anaerolineales bacterium]